MVQLALKSVQIKKSLTKVSVNRYIDSTEVGEGAPTIVGPTEALGKFQTQGNVL